MHRYSPGRFEMYKADSGALRFKIRHCGANGQGMLSLLSKSKPDKVLYDIIVGPDFTIITIRTGQTLRNIRSPLPEPIGLEFTEFWITWYGCVLRFGVGNNPEPLLTYRDGVSVENNIGFIKFNMRPSNIHPIPVEWDFEASPVILRAPAEKTFDDDLQWKGMIMEERNGNMVPLLPKGAMIGGYENEPIYIARAELFGSLCIGKYVPSKCSAFFPWGENEHQVQTCEILCGMNAKWVKTHGNHIPENAFVGGHSEVRNEPLYIGRAMHQDCLLVGKVHTLYSACYLPYKGKELCVKDYEILVRPNFKYRGKLLRPRRQRNNVDRTRSAEPARELREFIGNQLRPMANRDFLRRLMNAAQVQRVQAPEQPARGGQGVPPAAPPAPAPAPAPAPGSRAEATARAALEHRRQVVRWAASILAQHVPIPLREAYARRVGEFRNLRNAQREAAERLVGEVPPRADPLRGQGVAQGNQMRQEMPQAEPQRIQEWAQDAQLIQREFEAQRGQGIEQPAGGERGPPEGQGMPQDVGIQPEGQAARAPGALEDPGRIGIGRAFPAEVFEARVVVPRAVGQQWPVGHGEPRPAAGHRAEGMPPPPQPPPAAPHAFRDEFVAYIQRDWMPLPN